MKATFHIIEKVYASLKYDLLVLDNYRNIIHLPKHLIVNKGLKILEKKIIVNEENGYKIDVCIEGIEPPFFLLANIKENNSRQSKKLVAYGLFTKISQLIGVCEDDIFLKLNVNTENNDVNYELNRIKHISVEFKNYFQNKTKDIFQLNYKSYLDYLDDEIDEPNYNDLLLLIHHDSMIFPWINFLNPKTFNFLFYGKGRFRTNYGHYYDENEDASLYPNSMEVIIIPLFNGSKYFIDTYLASRKIITPYKFKSLDKTLAFSDYVDQFYNLKKKDLFSQNFHQKADWRVYEREYYSEYLNRLRDRFNTHFVYTIQPFWHDNMNKDTLEKLHNHIIKLSNALLKSGISNLIINPPINNIDYNIIMEEHSYDEQSRLEGQRDHDIIEELGDQELRNMDEETGGFWSIENDLD